MPARLASVPAFPTVVVKLLSLLGDERSSVTEIAACIAADPILTGRLLKRANTALTARCEIRNVLQAILALGLERTREVTLATATLAYLGSSMEIELLRPCWRHSVACAVIASEIAKISGIPPAEPYTAGLLHDIGRLGLLTAYPAEYEEILTHAATPGHSLRDAERARFGVDHTEAGLWLAQRWNLPESTAIAVARHHDVPSGRIDQLAVVQIACRVADLLGFPVSPQLAPPGFDEVTAAMPEAVRNRLWDRIGDLQTAILEQIAFFGDAEIAQPKTPMEVAVDEEEEQELLVELPLAFPRHVGVRSRPVPFAAIVSIIVALTFAMLLVKR